MSFKPILFLLLFICSLSASLEDLKGTYRIEEDVLISAEGKKYRPYPFSDPFHFELAYILKDVNQAEIIHKSYNRHISHLKKENPEATKSFQSAVLETCLLFGNPTQSPKNAFLTALFCQGEEGKAWIQNQEIEISAFIRDANQTIYPQIVSNQGKTYRVAVITTTCSGGNLSMSNALIEFLKKQPGIETIEIDTEEVAKYSDPILLATQSLTYDGIYSTIFQQTNDFSIIPERKKMRREIHRYIPSNFLAALKQKVLDAQPNLIISIRSYTPEDIALSSLGVPFRMMHVDFELCSSLNSYYRNVPVNSIRFWTHHVQASMFKPLFESHGRLDLYNSEDDFQTISEKVASFLCTTPEHFYQQFEVIGYLTSPLFYPIQEKTTLERLKKKWGIAEAEIPIFIMMGKHSTAASKEIFDALLHSQTKLPLKYLFICGKNQGLKKECEEILSLQDLSVSKKFTILELVTPTEVNEIMNISALGISKAGASSSVEIMATGSYVLLTHSYPWEEINGKQLIEMGFGKRYESQIPLIIQIEQCLQECKKKIAFDILAWQDNLLLKLKELRKSEQNSEK